MTAGSFSALRSHTEYRMTGQGPLKVLLLHALTGGPDAANRPGIKGWWGPLFDPGAPLDPAKATTLTPNLLGSCYGTTGPARNLSVRAQAEALALWIDRKGFTFDALIGGSMGGMVALELALLLPRRFRLIGLIGCSGRADAWLWGTHEIQRAILSSPSLDDAEAIALARRAAMLTFRSPEGLAQRFNQPEQVRTWLAHHGASLAHRFTRQSYLALLEAMDRHDAGQGRGGLEKALEGLGAPLHILGLERDQLFSRAAVLELAQAAKAAGRLGSLEWLQSPHGHDSFLMEWKRVTQWLTPRLQEITACAS